MMKKIFVVVAAFLGLSLTGPAAQGQVSLNVQIGPQPVCPYGYFDYAPYQCAPFGYYGPQWFTGGVFLGAGPWFHGPVGFRGYINRDFDPRFGYHGYLPRRGERADWGRHRGWDRNWHGNEWREERHGNGNHNGQYKEHGNPHGDRGHGNPHGDNGHGHGRE